MQYDSRKIIISAQQLNELNESAFIVEDLGQKVACSKLVACVGMWNR